MTGPSLTFWILLTIFLDTLSPPLLIEGCVRRVAQLGGSRWTSAILLTTATNVAALCRSYGSGVSARPHLDTIVRQSTWAGWFPEAWTFKTLKIDRRCTTAIQLLGSFETWIKFSRPAERAADNVAEARIAKSKRRLGAVIF
jgi:hypothetical protein